MFRNSYHLLNYSAIRQWLPQLISGFVSCFQSMSSTNSARWGGNSLVNNSLLASDSSHTLSRKRFWELASGEDGGISTVPHRDPKRILTPVTDGLRGVKRELPATGEKARISFSVFGFAPSRRPVICAHHITNALIKGVFSDQIGKLIPVQLVLHEVDNLR